MSTTPIFGLTLGEEGQAQGWPTANELFRMMELFGGVLQFLEYDRVAEPTSGLSEGDTYWTNASCTGTNWAGHGNEIATYFNSGWLFFDPTSGGLDIGGIDAWVDGGDSSIFAGQKICFSNAEDLWFPLQEMWSTTEYWTGLYGSGGTKLWCKCFEDTLPNATSKTIAHGITNLNRSEQIRFECSFDNGTTVYAMPQYFSPSYIVEINVNGTNIVVQTNVNLTSYTARMMLRYETT